MMYRENFDLLIHFCLVKYQMASSGFDQLSWLMMTNVSNTGTRMHRIVSTDVFLIIYIQSMNRYSRID